VNHAAEIDEQAATAIARLADAGIPLLSQSVLLRGVNDNVDALVQLFERLVDNRVMPYYLHQLDRVAGAAHFEVPEGRRHAARPRSSATSARLRRPPVCPRHSGQSEQETADLAAIVNGAIR
jgi:L-lysine 2,3-aminomutase